MPPNIKSTESVWDLTWAEEERGVRLTNKEAMCGSQETLAMFKSP